MDPQQQTQPTQDQGGTMPSNEAPVPQEMPTASVPVEGVAPNTVPSEPPVPAAPVPPVMQSPIPAPVPIDQNVPPAAAIPGPSVPVDNAPPPPKDPSSKKMKVLIGAVLVAIVLAIVLFAIFK